MTAERTALADAPPGVRPGRPGDLPRICEIFNHYVAHTTVTFYEEPFTPEERLASWFPQFAENGRHRLFVAEDAGRVVGVAWSAPFRPKPAYRTTVETTVYCDPEHRGRGIGRALYATLLEALADEDVHQVMGWIALPNDTSERLHRAVGFEHVGNLRNVGRKLGVWCDIAVYQLALGEQRSGAPV